MNSELDQLREEYRRERVGERLYGLLGQLVKATAPVYPPAIYAPSGVWDQSTLTDLLHDWIAKRLLRGDLELMLAGAASVGSLKAQLGTSLKQLIINGRQRDSATNLYRRTLDLLRKDSAYQTVGHAEAAQQQWTLTDEPMTEPSPLTLSELVAAAHQLTDEQLQVIRFGANSLKSSPILRKDALKTFTSHLLANAEGTLTMTRIADVQQHRFALIRQSPAELTEDIRDEKTPVELQVLAASAARAVLQQLQLRDIEALIALAHNNGIVSRAAAELGCSEGKIASARDRLAAEVAQFATSEQEAHEILRIFLESLFQ